LGLRSANAVSSTSEHFRPSPSGDVFVFFTRFFRQLKLKKGAQVKSPGGIPAPCNRHGLGIPKNSEKNDQLGCSELGRGSFKICNQPASRLDVGDTQGGRRHSGHGFFAKPFWLSEIKKTRFGQEAKGGTRGWKLDRKTFYITDRKSLGAGGHRYRLRATRQKHLSFKG